MQVDNLLLEKSMNQMTSDQFFEILYADITEDSYAAVETNNGEWALNEKKRSGKLSDWFKAWAGSGYIHKRYHEVFINYSKMEFLEEAFSKSNMQSIHFAFQWKLDTGMEEYGYAFLELVPSKNKDGHLCAGIFVKDITQEIHNYKAKINEFNKINEEYGEELESYDYEKIRNLASHGYATGDMISSLEFDVDTGVYTRQAFYHHAERLLKNNPDTDYTLGIIYVEGFESLASSYSSATAKEIIKKVADKTAGIVGDYGFVGRYSEDMMVGILPYDEKIFANKSRFEEGLFMREFTPYVKVFKYSFFPHISRELSVPEMCDRVIMALNTIKGIYGKNYVEYDKEFKDKLDKERQIESIMQEALDNNQFKVFYQPKHDLDTGELIGAEALVRWIHPEYGFMSPMEFIPLFEKNGFITQVDKYVWNTTCRNIRSWMDSRIKVVPISVNTSRLDFSSPNFMKNIVNPVNEYHIPVDLLHIEVTESLFSDRINELIEILNKCRELGFKIELDDFGTGYSSLNTLGELPLDIVKMDMSFMRKLDNPRRFRVLSACISLTKSLNLGTVCEGVETEQQIDVLKELGADSIQGYYYSKPLPEAEFEEYLSQYS